jgi:hypothetical protein
MGDRKKHIEQFQSQHHVWLYYLHFFHYPTRKLTAYYFTIKFIHIEILNHSSQKNIKILAYPFRKSRGDLLFDRGSEGLMLYN